MISLDLQLVHGYTPLQAGVAILPFEIAFVLTGPLSGRWSDKFGTLPFTTAGLCIISLALILFANVGVSTPYAIVALYLLVGGVGMGMFASPNMSSIMGSVPVQRRAVASALRATFFNVGYTLSLNLAILVMAFSLPFPLITQIISSLNPASISLPDRVGFAAALDRVYLTMAAVNIIAMVPNLLRGKRKVAKAKAEEFPMRPEAGTLEGD